MLATLQKIPFGDQDYQSKWDDLIDAINQLALDLEASSDNKLLSMGDVAANVQSLLAQAQAAAASAGSVVQQDLGAIDKTFFTSATLVDLCLYDTSKDSDGGAWRKRCGHTSWENETLSGNWLGSAANEAAARAIAGATTNSYYYDTTAAVFYKLNAGAGVTQVYRGNARQFPAQTLVTAEAARVVIWDLTQPGCPMWMVFSVSAGYHMGGSAPTAAVAQNASICAATNGSGLQVINFIADSATNHQVSNSLRRGSPISLRNTANTSITFSTSAVLVDLTCNDVAITALPTAPIDVATGLPVPTIAVATNGGVSVIKDDGNVWDITCSNATYTFSYDVAFTKLGNVMFSMDAASYARNQRVNEMPTADVSITVNVKAPSLEYYTSGSSDLNYPLPSIAGDASLAVSVLPNAVATFRGLTLLKRNPGTPTKGMLAAVSSAFNSGWQIGDIRGAWLADTTVETLIGAELAAAGNYGVPATYDDTLSGVTDTGFTATGATTASRVYLNLTTVVGKAYTVSVNQDSATAAVTLYGRDASNGGGNTLNSIVCAAGKNSLTFVATTTTSCVMWATAAAANFVFSAISSRIAVNDRSVKAKGMQVFGSISKTAVAAGAQLVSYSGWSAANYAQQPYNSDLDFGTGDFCIMGWLTEAPNSAIEYLFNRDSAAPGKAIRLWVNVAGYLVFELYDGATTRTATGTVAVDTSIRQFVFYTYIAGTLNIYLNCVLYATVTGAALLTLTNTSAVARIGCDVAGSYPATNANLALWRVSATIPSAEQIKHIYETEKALFQANAQCTLAGTSNAVTALAYDEDTDQLHVGTSWGRSAFKGLLRVASEATPVGSIVALAAGAGIIAQSGASGADVYVPAYTLREELKRRAEQIARFGQVLVSHDFEAGASQTTFALPVGWEIAAVYAASGAGSATLQREGSGKQWTRAFDGFKWSAVFAAGRSASDWISILARRTSL